MDSSEAGLARDIALTDVISSCNIVFRADQACIYALAGAWTGHDKTIAKS